MLACPHPAFIAIRAKAQNKQGIVAVAMRAKYESDPVLQTLIENFCHYSWHPESPHVRRIWLGMWSNDLHRTLITPHSIDDAATMADRTNAGEIASALTAPLRAAHRQIIHHITAWPRSRTSSAPETLANADPIDPLPLLDHIPADQHMSATNQHTIDSLRLGDSSDAIDRHYRRFAHILHTNTTSDILPASPDDQYYMHDPYACADAAMQMPDTLHPADAREYDS